MRSSIIPYERNTRMNSEKYVGLRSSIVSVALLDSTGKLVMESMLRRPPGEFDSNRLVP